MKILQYLFSFVMGWLERPALYLVLFIVQVGLLAAKLLIPAFTLSLWWVFSPLIAAIVIIGAMWFIYSRLDWR